MKKFITLVTTIVLSIAAFSQAPTKFNYQAVARDAAGKALSNKAVSTQISILKTTATGQDVYVETHAVTTNKFGLFNFQIGEGTVVSGSISNIDWSSDSYFVKVEFDGDGGTNYTVLSTTQLVSVPYSLFANNVLNDKVDDADADATNELQSLSIKGDTVFLTNGGFVKLPASSGFDGKYSSLTGAPTTVSSFSNDAGYLTTEKDSSVTNELQTLNFNNDTLFLSDGGKVYLGAYKSGVSNDNDSTNEIQMISMNNDTLILSNGGKVYLGAFSNAPNNDNDSTNELQVLSFSNDTMFLTNGGKVYLGAYSNAANNDNDSTNELQMLSISNDTVFLTNGSSVKLPAGFDGKYSSLTGAPTTVSSFTNDAGYLTTETDGSVTNEIQALSISNDTLYLTNGGKVYLGGYSNVANNDNDSTNELQMLSISNDTVFLTNGSSVKLPAGFDGKYSSLTGAPTNVSSFTNDAGYLTAEIDGSVTNEIQALSISNDTLYLTNGGKVYLGGYSNVANNDNDSTNELQMLSISNDTVYLSNGGSIKLPAGFDGKYSSLTGAPTNVSSFSNDAGYLTAETDGSVTNEIQTLSMSNDTVYLSDGGKIYLGAYANAVNNDNDSTNEIQMLSISNDTIKLSNGGTVKIPTQLPDGNAAGNTLYWDGTKWVTNSSNIYNNGGNVGIGNSNPQGKLQVGNNIATGSLDNFSEYQLLIYQSASAVNSYGIGVRANTLAVNTDALVDIDVDGVASWRFHDRRIEALNSGNSVFIGPGAGAADDKTDNRNIGIGYNALLKNTTGNSNIAIGAGSLNNITTGTNNVALGHAAGLTATTGSGMTAVGSSAANSSTGNGITAVGYQALSSNSTGSGNTALGYQAGHVNTTTNGTTFMGYQAGYGNRQHYTTAIGDGALRNNSTGSANTAVGYRAGNTNTTTNGLTAVGYNAARGNRASNTTAIGAAALDVNSTGADNTGVGANSLGSNTTGRYNTAVGSEALLRNNGSQNTAVGYRAAYGNTSGLFNVAIGDFALTTHSTRRYSTAVGSYALTRSNADWNTAVGTRAAQATTTGFQNTAVGGNALYSNTTGLYNTAMGVNSLFRNVTGRQNTAVGVEAAYNSTGTDNVVVGHKAVYNGRTINATTAIGQQAGIGLANGNYNTYIGRNAGAQNHSISNFMAIGYNAPVTGGSNFTMIGNTAQRELRHYGLIRRLSDGRFKTNVQENIPGIEFIVGLRPVSYEFDMDKLNAHVYGTENVDEEYNEMARNAKAGYVESGFIAQEVDELAKSLNYNFDGVASPQSKNDHYAISYNSFVVPLVKATQEQQQIIEKQQKEIDALKSLIKEIQKEIKAK